MEAHDCEEEWKDLDVVNACEYVENELMKATIPKKRWHKNHKKNKPLWMNGRTHKPFMPMPKAQDYGVELLIWFKRMVGRHPQYKIK